MGTKKIHSNYNKYVIILILGVFWAFLLMQFRLVWIYYDDWGYYTLNYGTTNYHSGTSYNLQELWIFLKDHYAGANGRLLYIFFWLVLNMMGGLKLVRFSASLIVTAVFALLFCTSNKGLCAGIKGRHLLGMFILCLCYGLIPIELHNRGTYWFAAFFFYYLPIIFISLFAYFYYRWRNDLNLKHTAILVGLSLCSSWSVENWSVAMVISMMTILGIDVVKTKRIHLQHILFTMASLTGMAIMFLSPGLGQIAENAGYNALNMEFILMRTKTVFCQFFSGYNHAYLFVLITCILILNFILIRRYRMLIDKIEGVFLAVIDFVELFFKDLWRELFGSRYGIIIILLFLISLLVPICRYYYHKKNARQTLVLYTAFLSMASLACVPNVSIRTFIPFILCSLTIIEDAFQECYLLTKDCRFMAVLEILLSVYIVCFSVMNTSAIYEGYKKNYKTHMENHRILLDTQKAIEEGAEISEVHLAKNPDDQYAAGMLYQNGYEWFEFFIDAYYELPADIQYLYE